MESESRNPEKLSGFRFDDRLLAILKVLHGKGHQAFVVGGSVRDILLGRPPSDFDITTSARADETNRIFKGVVIDDGEKASGGEGAPDTGPAASDAGSRKLRCQTLETGIKHGTVLVRVKPLDTPRASWFESEVTTFRGEGEYLDGRHPESVVFLDDIEGDLARRDFTINAMAYDPVGGQFVDHFGGLEDLSQRVIRCVGRPMDRFSEDGLRPLRAVRFAAVLDFDIHPETLDAIPKTLATFEKVSWERKNEEFVKLLMSAHPLKGLRLLNATGLFQAMFPEFSELANPQAAFTAALERLERLLCWDARASLETRLSCLLMELSPAALFGTAGMNPLPLLMKRLRFSNSQMAIVTKLCVRREFGLTSYKREADLRKALSSVGPESVDQLLALAVAQGLSVEDRDSLKGKIHRVLLSAPPLSLKDLALDGTKIGQALGAGAGPLIGKAMAHLLNAVLEDPTMNTPDRLREELSRAFPKS